MKRCLSFEAETFADDFGEAEVDENEAAFAWQGHDVLGLYIHVDYLMPVQHFELLEQP